MFKQYILIFILALSSFLSYAGTMVLEDYPIMYFPDKKGIKLDVVQEIVADAVDRSSYPKHLWMIDSEKPGEIIARLNVRTHILRMKITFDEHMINYQYHDSTRLSYSENDSGIREIHSKYKPWSEFLLSKIKFVAKRKSKTNLVYESPFKKVIVASESGLTGKPVKLVFSVYGDTNNRGHDSGIYSDAAMSQAMTKVISKHLNNVKPGNATVESFTWTNNIYNFMYKKNNKNAINVCQKYNADVFIAAYLEDYIGGTSGNRDLNIQLFTCNSKDKVKQVYDTVDSYDEKFAYHFGIIKNLKMFIGQFNPFMK